MLSEFFINTKAIPKSYSLPTHLLRLQLLLSSNKRASLNSELFGKSFSSYFLQPSVPVGRTTNLTFS